MNETSLSLLERLQTSPETEHWQRLVDLYGPLLTAWMRKYDVSGSDAEDLLQEVLLAVSKALSNYEHRGQPGAFRAWLKGILINRLRNFWRTRDRRPKTAGGPDVDSLLTELESPTSELSSLWDREHDEFILGQLLPLVKPHFAPNTWTAFCRVALDGQPPARVADDLKISLNAVVIAKSRVLSRLRQEADGLVESSFCFDAIR